MKWILNKVYGLPASITIIKGFWKTGKTDFGLKLTEFCSQEKLCSAFASNIETENSNVEFINNFSRLDYWLYSTSHKKMFLYDEVVESSPSRGAMTSLNINWLRRIPQLSKGRCHLIAITQEENLIDSVFRNPTFCRGLWTKITKTKVTFQSKYFIDKTLCWNNLPKTTILFNPYLTASFKLSGESGMFDLLPEALKVLTLYGEGKSFSMIMQELGINHPELVRRLLKRACKAVSLTVSQQPTEGDKLAKTCEEVSLKDH